MTRDLLAFCDDIPEQNLEIPWPFSAFSSKEELELTFCAHPFFLFLLPLLSTPSQAIFFPPKPLYLRPEN